MLFSNYSELFVAVHILSTLPQIDDFAPAVSYPLEIIATPILVIRTLNSELQFSNFSERDHNLLKLCVPPPHSPKSLVRVPHYIYHIVQYTYVYASVSFIKV